MTAGARTRRVLRRSASTGTLVLSASRAGPLPRRSRAVHPRRQRREADVPAQHQETQEDPRFPHPYADTRWARRAAVAPDAWPEAALGLIWRIRDRATFAALARAPRRRVGPISLRCVPGDPTCPARVAYAVGRKAGSAVDRNRIRRRLRAAVAESAASFAAGSAYLLEADRTVLTTPFDDLCVAISAAVRASSGAAR
jgi:ribonuclease P protein component